MIYDVVIIGGGHNGLVAACYLGLAGKKVLIIEKNDYIGGATTSQKVFPEYDARLSRYSYLISLFPKEILEELNLDVKLLRRATASCTPYFENNRHKALLLSNIDEEISHQSVLELGFGESEWEGYQTLMHKKQIFAELIWDSFLQPLKSKEYWQSYFQQNDQIELWNSFVEKPIGQFIEEHVQSDIFRGLLLTDAKIATHTHAHDESLRQNKTFIYHTIGNKTGEWLVPAGGTGNLANQLIVKALDFGVEMKKEAKVKEISLGKEFHRVFFEQDGKDVEVRATYILSNVAPSVLAAMMQDSSIKKPHAKFAIQEAGSIFKINMLLKKLPQLKDLSIRSEEAFAGTFHLNQSYTQMKKSFDEAASGRLPEIIPGEIYCHTLTDNSILSEELFNKGFHSLTLFGLDLPYSLFELENEKVKETVIKKYLAGINDYLVEPLEECLAKDSAGNFCLEGKSPKDLEDELNMPSGNIFHNPLTWFFAENDSQLNTWGVETEHERVFICGSGAIRGGNVSGIAGRNAAMKVLKGQ